MFDPTSYSRVRPETVNRHGVANRGQLTSRVPLSRKSHGAVCTDKTCSETTSTVSCGRQAFSRNEGIFRILLERRHLARNWLELAYPDPPEFGEKMGGLVFSCATAGAAHDAVRPATMLLASASPLNVNEDIIVPSLACGYVSPAWARPLPVAGTCRPPNRNAEGNRTRFRATGAQVLDPIHGWRAEQIGAAIRECLRQVNLQGRRHWRSGDRSDFPFRCRPEA